MTCCLFHPHQNKAQCLLLWPTTMTTPVIIKCMMLHSRPLLLGTIVNAGGLSLIHSSHGCPVIGCLLLVSAPLIDLLSAPLVNVLCDTLCVATLSPPEAFGTVLTFCLEDLAFIQIFDTIPNILSFASKVIFSLLNHLNPWIHLLLPQQNDSVTVTCLLT